MAKKQAYMTHNEEKNQAIETNPKLTHILLLARLQNFYYNCIVDVKEVKLRYGK